MKSYGIAAPIHVVTSCSGPQSRIQNVQSALSKLGARPLLYVDSDEIAALSATQAGITTARFMYPADTIIDWRPVLNPWSDSYEDVEDVVDLFADREQRER